MLLTYFKKTEHFFHTNCPQYVGSGIFLDRLTDCVQYIINTIVN